jgi:hypothetical protein
MGAFKPYQPFSWYRCGNQRCGLLTALPDGMVGGQLALVPWQILEFEPLILVCSHCDCISNCTPIGKPAPFPAEVLSKCRRMSYSKLWLRCGVAECKSLTRLMVCVDCHTTLANLKELVSTKKVIGVRCCFGHSIVRALAA